MHRQVLLVVAGTIDFLRAAVVLADPSIDPEVKGFFYLGYISRHSRSRLVSMEFEFK